MTVLKVSTRANRDSNLLGISYVENIAQNASKHSRSKNLFGLFSKTLLTSTFYPYNVNREHFTVVRSFVKYCFPHLEIKVTLSQPPVPVEYSQSAPLINLTAIYIAIAQLYKYFD